MENITLELIEPIGGPSIWKDFLDRKGEGVHNFAIKVADLPTEIEDHQSAGMSVIQQGNYDAGSYAYIDTLEKLGIVLELLQIHSSIEEKNDGNSIKQ